VIPHSDSGDQTVAACTTVRKALPVVWVAGVLSPLSVCGVTLSFLLHRGLIQPVVLQRFVFVGMGGTWVDSPTSR
jgi:hypothetical protein